MKSFLIIFIFSYIFSITEKDEQITQLVFIYNAKNGLINGMFDYVHKFVSPETYQCNLCSITYDMGGKKDQRTEYLNRLPLRVQFAYKNNILESNFNVNYKNQSLPCVFLIKDKKQFLILSSREINKMETLDELKKILSKKLIKSNVLLDNN